MVEYWARDMEYFADNYELQFRQQIVSSAS